MIFENCIYFLHIELHKPHAIYLYIKHSGSSVQYTVFYFLFCIKVVSSNIFTPLTDNYYIYTDARYFSHFLINFFYFGPLGIPSKLSWINRALCPSTPCPCWVNLSNLLQIWQKGGEKKSNRKIFFSSSVTYHTILNCSEVTLCPWVSEEFDISVGRAQSVSWVAGVGNLLYSCATVQSQKAHLDHISTLIIKL